MECRLAEPGRAERHRGVHRQLDGSRVGLVADGGHGGVAGYAAGEVHDDGEGFIDFVAVDPPRGTGVGRQLVVAITRQLLDRSMLGRASRCRTIERRPGPFTNDSAFRPDGSLIAYRSWTL
jgi:GNAT superfamily N-acetyltransferase